MHDGGCVVIVWSFCTGQSQSGAVLMVVLQSPEVLAAWSLLGGEICINSTVNQSGAAGLAAVKRLVASRKVR